MRRNLFFHGRFGTQRLLELLAYGCELSLQTVDRLGLFANDQVQLVDRVVLECKLYLEVFDSLFKMFMAHGSARLRPIRGGL